MLKLNKITKVNLKADKLAREEAMDLKNLDRYARKAVPKPIELDELNECYFKHLNMEEFVTSFE